MQEWFLSLDTTMQVYWGIAIIASAIFLLQTILTIIGMDSTDGMDADFDISDGDTMDTGGAVSLFSIRSLINFCVGFGWAGICLRESISNNLVLGIAATLVGVAFGALYPFIRKRLMRLESNGAYKISDCVGKEADVYLRIPAAGNGKGKVQVSINGAVHEFNAVSDSEELPTGSRVRILSVEGSVLTVTRK